MGCLIYMPLILPLDAGKKKITLGLWSITWTKNKYISVLKMHCFEDLRACCYLIMCNNCIQY